MVDFTVIARCSVTFDLFFPLFFCFQLVVRGVAVFPDSFLWRSVLLLIIWPVLVDRKSWASLPTGWGWPFNFSPCLTSRKSHSLCATATGICARFFWGQNLVIQKTTSGHLKKIRQFAPAPTPFVSSVGNPPTDQDSNCVPFRFLAFLLLETVYLFRSVRTLVPIFRCLIFSLSCSKLFKAVVESCGFGEFGFGFIRRIAAFSVSVSNSR